MATQYVDEVLRVQPQGPYRLGGMCAGGTIAFEMALQLEARGQVIEWVALLDSADAQARRRPFLRSRRRLQSFLAALRGAGSPGTPAAADAHAAPPQATSGAAPSSRWQRAAAKAANLIAYELASARRTVWSSVRFRALRRVLRGGGPVPAWLEQLSVRTVYDRAQREYEPAARLRGTALLFRATSGEGADEPFTALFADPLLGWEGRSVRPVQVHDLPGGHSTMLAEPHVEVLAGHLRARLG
jgi:thioesterase domain-containing protein